MPLTTPIPLVLGRFKQLALRSQEVWQGGLVRMPMWIASAHPGGEPWRPTGALWVSVRTGLIHLVLPEEGEAASPDFAVRALLDFGLKHAKELGGRPARIDVTDPALRDALSGTLANLSTIVSVVDNLPAVSDVLQQLEADTSGGKRLPGLLDAGDISPERLRAFADAAASFYRASPWHHLANEDLIVVGGDDIARNMRHVSVMGQGGEQFGLGFFESRAAFARIIEHDDISRATNAHGITFGTIDELPFADVDAWLDQRLPTAAPHAYPLAASLHKDGTMDRPNARELTNAEALLRALAATTEDELDSGRWEKRVDTFDGEVTLRMTLPGILDAGKASNATRLRALPRAAERSAAHIARFLEARGNQSLDDINAELERARQAGLLDQPEAGGRPLSTLEQAQEKAFDAMEADGRLRIKMAREALAISADCADAWGILADAAPTVEIAVERYQQAMAAGRRAIGSQFDEMIGEFWGHIATRPYIRARFELAQALAEMGRDDEALSHYRELLRLNPNDNQGVRFVLIVALLDLQRDDEAGTLLAAYPDERQALWLHARALWLFRREGDTTASRAALESAVGANRHALKYLVDLDAMKVNRQPYFTVGSKEEAAYVAVELIDICDSTSGAHAWLRKRSRGATKPKAKA